MEVLSEIILRLDPIDIKSFKSTTYEMQYFIEEVEKDEEYWRKKLSRHLGFEVFQRVGKTWRKIYEKVLKYEKALVCLADLNYLEIVDGLIKQGVSPSRTHNAAIRRAADKGHAAMVKLLMSDPRVNPADLDNYAIQSASVQGHADVVKLLLTDKRVDPNPGLISPFTLAMRENHLDVVKVLLEDSRVNPAEGNFALGYASQYGFVEIVELLLNQPKVDPTSNDNFAIRMASQHGRTEVVKLLLEDGRADPSVDNNYPIRMAAENGHTKIVKLLLEDPKVDPSADDNAAIRNTKKKNIIKLLLKDPRVKSELTERELKKFQKQII